MCQRTLGSIAHDDADATTIDPSLARSNATMARLHAEYAREKDTERQHQFAGLNARETERGLVITLGDGLFETGRSELKRAASGDLHGLAVFLNSHEDRTASVEGHTDAVGSEDSNLHLSRLRAESVKSYLLGEGVDSKRIVAVGKGENEPVADNESDSGRRLNRRVEVVVSAVAVPTR